MYSFTVFGVHGKERDLILRLKNSGFALTDYQMNNQQPFDSIIKFADASQTARLYTELRDLTVLNGHPVTVRVEPNEEAKRILSPPSQRQPPSFLVTPRFPGPPPRQQHPPRNGGPQQHPPRNGFSGQQQRPQNGVSGRQPSRGSPPQQAGTPSREERIKEIKEGLRCILSAEKKGMDAMRLYNDFRGFFSKDMFEETKKLGYRTFTDFCNDNLDAIEYDNLDGYGTVVVFHGIADAKTAHIFNMNQNTRSKHAPNCKPIPSRFQSSFGNFKKPAHKVAEMQRQFSKPLPIPDKIRRRIMKILEDKPGLQTRQLLEEYRETYEEQLSIADLRAITKKSTIEDILSTISQIEMRMGLWYLTPQQQQQSSPSAPSGYYAGALGFCNRCGRDDSEITFPVPPSSQTRTVRDTCRHWTRVLVC